MKAKVKIVEEVKRSDGLWRFACGDVFVASFFIAPFFFASFIDVYVFVASFFIAFH